MRRADLEAASPGIWNRVAPPGKRTRSRPEPAGKVTHKANIESGAPDRGRGAVEEAMSEWLKRPAPDEQVELPPQVEGRIMKAFHDRHCRETLDEPMAMPDGKPEPHAATGCAPARPEVPRKFPAVKVPGRPLPKAERERSLAASGAASGPRCRLTAGCATLAKTRLRRVFGSASVVLSNTVPCQTRRLVKHGAVAFAQRHRTNGAQDEWGTGRMVHRT